MSNKKVNLATSPDADEQMDFKRELFKNMGPHVTLSMKLVIVVGLVSSFCIAVLVVLNWQANNDISGKIENVMALRDTLSQNLRGEIVNLQDKYLKIPQYLEVDPQKDILEWIKTNYPGMEEKVIEGRDNYTSFFSRTQKRDLSRGCFVPHLLDGDLMVSRGLLDEQGNFSEAINMMRLPSDNPQGDLEKVTSEIEVLAKTASSAKLQQSITALKGKLADEAISAEKTRNEIVRFVDKIVNEDLSIKNFREQKQRISTYIAVATILVNLAVLYLLTTFIVEMPLRKLYQVINRIQEGHETRIPFQQRHDKIGVLARTIQSFKHALDNLKMEEQRKLEEQKMVQGFIALMTEMIHSLQSRSREMANTASHLHDLAVITENLSSQVNDSAIQTASNTDAVSEAVNRLKSAVENISSQIGMQNQLMEKMFIVAGQSLSNMNALDVASTEIVSIIKLVKDISGQTKLLSLNASIEAARSGSAGNGFTVLASEIRALSNQTEKATAEIEDKIMAIQKASHNIIESIQSIEGRIGALTESATHIHATVVEQKQATDDIARNADMTSGETLEVSQRIEEVKGASEQTRGLAGQVQERSQVISNELDALLNMTMEKLAGIGIEKNSLLCVRREGRKGNIVKESKTEDKKECIEKEPDDIKIDKAAA
ncbi:MAG: hypothetical protein HQK62_10990 [Desulfamplus sp.]|nr:hypothetical protein [Desulfamplus sp.]